MDEQREQSRLEYLRRRQAQQLELERLRLEEERRLFKEEDLTERERSRRKIREEVLQLAERRGAKEEESVSYYLPESFETAEGRVDYDKRAQAFHAKHSVKEERRSGVGRSDGARWEQQQIEKAIESSAIANTAIGGGQYELVLPDQVEFVLQELLEGKDPVREMEEQRLRLEEEAKKKANAVQSKFDAIQESRKKLPVYPYREELLNAVREHQVLIIVGETGSGKTTQVMQYLYEDGYCDDGRMVGCTQPRRVAAMSVATRVAEEKGVKVGREVGYSVRFDECTSEKTRIKYLTDGMLLREFLSSPDLAKYSVLMIDEAHERTLHTDILFGLLKDIAKCRPDLKLLISSATLDAKKFSDYFNGAPIFLIPGRRYPVDIYYTKAPEADYVDASVVTVMQIHVTQPKGDILVFLPGQDDIEAAEELLRERMRSLGDKVGSSVAELLILPIYANLPSELQARIFQPTPEGARKVVLATNIAETSLTIDGITFVVDPGFCKSKNYSTKGAGAGIESLTVAPISKASAQQRAGRAGRVAPGKCFRLFTREAFEEEMEENTVPEIQRTNLVSVVLLLKSLGINNLVDFDFLDPPPAGALIRALETLYALAALNQQGQLTRLGRRMAELPLEPMLARCLLASAEWGCVRETVMVCGMLSAGAVFFRPKDRGVEADNAHRAFWDPHGDPLTLLNVMTQWEENECDEQWCQDHFVQYRIMQRAKDVSKQLLSMCKRVGIDVDAPPPTLPPTLPPLTHGSNSNAPPADADAESPATLPLSVRVRRALVAGFFFHAAKLEGDSYRTVKTRQQVYVHPSSCLAIKRQDKNKKPAPTTAPVAAAAPPPAWVVYFELVKTSKDYIRGVAAVEAEWLFKAAPHYFNAERTKEKEKGVSRAGKMKAGAKVG